MAPKSVPPQPAVIVNRIAAEAKIVNQIHQIHGPANVMQDLTSTHFLWALTLGAVIAVSLPLGSLVGLQCENGNTGSVRHETRCQGSRFKAIHSHSARRTCASKSRTSPIQFGANCKGQHITDAPMTSQRGPRFPGQRRTFWSKLRTTEPHFPKILFCKC